MRGLRDFLWHLLWLIVLVVTVMTVREEGATPFWLDFATVAVVLLWVALTAAVWRRPTKDMGIYARMDAGEDIPACDRVAHATEVWDDLGKTNDGRRYRKKLFKPYLEEMGIGDTAVAKSIRRQQEKRNDQ